MGKHKKHGYGHKSSSSSSSSSSSEDEQYRHLPKHERKRLKKLRKQQRKGKLPHGAMPGMYPGAAPHGMPGQHGMPGHGAPGYPGQPAYPPAGGAYPGAAGGYPTGVVPPPQAGYGPPPPGGYPGGAPGYPQPPAQAYPGQQQPYPGQPPPAGVYPGAGQYPPTNTTTAPTSSSGAGGFAPPPGGAPSTGYGAPSGPSAALGFAASGSGPYPGAPPPQPAYAPAPGYPQGGYPQPGGAPPPQPGYPQPGGPGYPQPGVPAQPGLPPAQPGMVPPAQPGYPQPGPPGIPPGGVPPGQMGPGGVGGAAAQFQRMGLQGTADVPRPTIRPAANFSAERDTDVIRKAMKGMGTDERAIIDIISQRSNQQRQQIMTMFKTMYGKDIIRDLESELSGDFRETIMALFKATTFYDAWTLYQAMSGAGTKEAPLIEILCTRTNAEIREINECYKLHYHRTLERDIMDDTSGHFKRLLVSCCQANRSELTPQQLQRVQYEGAECVIDRNLARDDAQKLFQAGEKKMGTDESVFLQVMALRHYYQLRATFEEYVKISGRDILSSVSREMSGDLEDGFKAMVMSAKNRPEYFADKLHDAMKGAGTRDSTLIRIIVSRSEIDLQDIKEVYLFKYHKTLATAINSDTSGDYKRLLLAIAGQ